MRNPERDKLINRIELLRKGRECIVNALASRLTTRDTYIDGTLGAIVTLINLAESQLEEQL